MNKQEILKEINKTKEHLANMEKMLAEIIDDIDSLGPSCDFCAYADISPEKICSKPRGEKCKDGILQWLNQESE